MEGKRIPNTLMHVRVRDGADGIFQWADLTTDEIFARRNVVVFGVPGAFTPACSESHLPRYEALHDEIVACGIDEIICVSVNDAFVMHQWAKSRGIEKIRMLPDGNGEFARSIDMMVSRSDQGMGPRSWRYSMYVEDGVIRIMFAEPDFRDNPPGVPVTVSDAQVMLDYLKAK